ncbi:MAG TPA: hypothetical protein VGN96_11220 [Roseococcus sp.]|nr:hypothetical protein [Roseococcus sp.]
MPDGSIARRRKRGQPASSTPMDHGPPSITLDAKGKPVALLHHRLEVVDAADPDSPARTIRRARVVCHYDTAWKRGALTDAEREACDRYAILCDRAEGAQERRGGPSEASSPWTRTPPLTALQALASLRQADKAVGGDGAALLRLWVTHNVAAEEIARRRGERREVCMGRIRAATLRLAEWWEMA